MTLQHGKHSLWRWMPATYPGCGGRDFSIAWSRAPVADWWMGELRRAGGAADVEVAIDPAELEGLDEEAVRALYDERLAQQQSTASREVTFILLITLQNC